MWEGGSRHLSSGAGVGLDPAHMMGLAEVLNHFVKLKATHATNKVIAGKDAAVQV